MSQTTSRAPLFPMSLSKTSMSPPPLPSASNASTLSQRIPGFAESGFDALPIGPSPVPKSFDTAYPSRNNSLVDFRTHQRDPRTHPSPHNLRLTIGDAMPSPMYTFSANRSPMPSPDIHMSRQLGYTPIDPSPASSTTSSIHSTKGTRGRQTRKQQPSARPAAKRMRDTRDREGTAIQHMEIDLESEGLLADLKPLNANNKEEAGRRYPKADVLERYCELSNDRKLRRESLDDDLRRSYYDVTKCHTLERWCERWGSTFSKEARENLDAMLAEMESPEPRAPSVHSTASVKTSLSFSGRSSISEFEQSSATSAEWSASDEYDYMRKSSRHSSGGFPTAIFGSSQMI